MHSAWYRANAVLTFSTTVLAGLCLAATVIDSFHRGQVDVQASVSNIESLRKEPTQEYFYHRRSKQELSDRARVWVDLSLDLRDEFTWMTKQLFVFVTVDFQTRKNTFNQMLMWSQIVVNQADAVIQGKDLADVYPYVVNDQGFDMRGRPFNLTVSWNMMPLVGVLRTRSRTFSGYEFPGEYTPASTRKRGSGAQREQVSSPSAHGEENQH